MKSGIQCIFVFSLLLGLNEDVASSAGGIGKIYIVYGSDTSIRSGLDVSRFHITAKPDLFLGANSPAQRIMNPSYRAQITDSYGHPLIMTWWMLCGGIFRYGTNANVPYANTFPLHLMQKYHGASMQQFGDELTLHYHTWKWTDDNGDGIWWWNQSRTFAELRDDFDFTVAQCLLEENMFPVSFRSGWHYMDNVWQQYLNDLIPYCMHNDVPNVHADNTEPIDNVYDWSRAPTDWKPFHPSPNDYQRPGNSNGWNLRSAYMRVVTRDALEQAFVKAAQGEDQVLCLWEHLADDTFFPSLERVNGLLHQLSAQYTGVRFEFKSAVEAMQLWRGTQDTVKPSLSLQEMHNGTQVAYSVQTNEPIFQGQPFVAVKTKSEQFIVAQMESVGTNRWRTVQSFNADSLAKVACAVTDTAGNLSKQFITYVPGDTFYDNTHSGYHELLGTWRTIASETWGLDSRAATVAPNDSAVVEWQADIIEARQYKVFVQLPEVPEAVQRLRFVIRNNGVEIATRAFSSTLPSNKWVYLGTFPFTQSPTVRMTGYADSSAMNLGADVIKLSPLVQQNEMHVTQEAFDFGYKSLNDTVRTVLFVENRGSSSQTITEFRASTFRVLAQLPISLPAGRATEVPMAFVFDRLGSINDTLQIQTINTSLALPVSASVEYIVRIVDNEDAGSYFESGIWNTSVAVANRNSSRFSYLYQGPGQYARFITTVPQSGFYDIQEIVPSSSNATNRALYTVTMNGRILDSVYLDQRQSSNVWVLLGAFQLEAGSPIEIRVTHAGGNTAGEVLRADAVKLTWVDVTQLHSFIVDNDSAGYSEIGVWARSTGQAYGPSSRYSLIGSTTGQYASFTTKVNLPGRYEVRQIVPASANATNHALYTISVDGAVIDSMFLDQQVGGGTWVSLGSYNFPARRDIEVRIIHAGGNTAGDVLRADAIMLVPIISSTVNSESPLPLRYALEQNYPNPFNPSTTITFQLPASSRVELRVYDMLGREVATLVNEQLQAGTHKRLFIADRLASGVYLYRLQAESFSSVKKMIILK